VTEYCWSFGRERRGGNGSHDAGTQEAHKDLGAGAPLERCLAYDGPAYHQPGFALLEDASLWHSHAKSPHEMRRTTSKTCFTNSVVDRSPKCSSAPVAYFYNC